jgi:hypothetical protein
VGDTADCVTVGLFEYDVVGDGLTDAPGLIVAPVVTVAVAVAVGVGLTAGVRGKRATALL